MVATVAFNPTVTTNALGSFSVYSDGLYQGVAFDDPATRFALAGGYVASTETVPMWGGIGITEHIPPTSGNGAGVLGGSVTRATAETNLTGFTVFNQAHAGITTPQSPVPQFGSYQSINFYRFGSGARIALKIDPALVTLDGQIITSQVSWDYTNQMIVAYDSVAALPVKILQIDIGNSKTVSRDSGTGFVTWNTSGACAVVLI